MECRRLILASEDGPVSANYKETDFDALEGGTASC